MTEEEWPASLPLQSLFTDIGGETPPAAVRERAAQRLFSILGQRATGRKLRLFAVAVCRRIAPGLLLRQSWRGLVVAEKIADETATLDDVEAARSQLGELHALEVHRNSWKPPEYTASAALSCLNPDPWMAARYAISTAWHTSQPPREKVWAIETVARLRDIFGNPFRPVAFDPAWRTDTAVSLARQMYESREFGAMPILADALQDAGCENEDILTHCRDPKQVHVRGCWVVDLVLGKS